MRLAVIVIVVTSSACGLATHHYTEPGTGDAGDDGAGDDAVPLDHSGSRLQLVQLVFDGATLPYAAHDPELGADCVVATWSNGKRYCTPDNAEIVYKDGQCTMPVMRAVADKGPFFAHAGNDSTGGVTHLFRASAPFSATEIYVRDGVCHTQTVSLATPLFELGDEVRPTDLVEITVAADDPGSLSNYYFRGSDGFQVTSPGYLRDIEHDADCFILDHEASYPTYYCRPVTATITRTYSDAACTQAMVAIPTTADIAYVATAPPPDHCEEIGALHTIGAAITPTQAFTTNSSGGCAPANLSASPYFGMGSATLPLQPLQHQAIVQAGRRIENAQLVAGAQVFRDYDLFDTTFNTWCITSVQADAQIMCVPEADEVETLYLDPSCMLPTVVIAVRQRQSACGYANAPRYALESTGSGHVVLQVGDSLPGPFFELSGVGCQEVAPSTSFYTPGDLLPVSTFAAGTLVTEPTR